MLTPRLVAAALAVVTTAGVGSAVVLRPSTPAASAAAPAAGVPTPAPVDMPVPTQAPRPVPVAAVRVAPLKDLRSPDLLLAATRPLTAAQLAALGKVKGLQAVTVLDAGPARVAGRSVRVVGVDPSQFRAFTPKETAGSDALWAAVARGELAPTYALARAAKLPLGGTVPVTGSTITDHRVGAVAVFGVPQADLVVDRATARALGVAAGTSALVAAPDRGILDLRRDVRAAVGDAVVLTVLRPQTVTPYRGKPRTYRELYIDSAKYCPGLSWTVLAAIGQVESDHGRNAGVSSAGAMGPMQFLPSTWASYGVDGDGDGKADINNAFDAVPSAALYLCRNGAGQGGQALYDAVFAYNHADWYVKLVLGLAAKYE